MKRNVFFVAALSCVANLYAVEPVYTTTVHMLQDVQVTSTRADKRTPMAYTNIGKAQLKQVNFGQDIPHLLSLTPSVTTTSDAGNGIGYTSIRVRGVDPSRINITANGIPVNDAESSQVFFVNMGDFATENGIAVKILMDEEPGYRWEVTEANREYPEFAFAMKEKGGYANEYSLRQLVRTNERADYPHLTDAEFANFREVKTRGMGKGVFYRSSSPVDPQLGRNAYADAALEAAGVRTVINLADTMAAMQTYPDYSESAYAKCSVIALNLGLDVQSKEFEAGLLQGLRFMMEHSAPYLVHCTEGKDRGGFVSAIMECLMGASWQEVMEDYMTTYENYYGTQPESESYRIIAENNMKKTLEAAFDVEDIAAPDVRLEDEAQIYLTERVGLTDDEVKQLIACLSGM